MSSSSALWRSAKSWSPKAPKRLFPLGGKIYPYVVTPEELEPQLGVPVINTKAVGVSYAELMARNQIKHSIKAYPCPTGLDPDAVSKRSK